MRMGGSKKIKQDKNGNRFLYRLGVYVSMDGKTVYTPGSKGIKREYHKIENDPQGRPYIMLMGSELHLVERLVAICFRPMPNDKKQYMLFHKDGNISNCHANNLEWKEIIPQPYTPNTDSMCWVGKCVVTSHGEVYYGKDKLTISNTFYDPDTDLFLSWPPYVRIGRKRIDIDDFMAAAHYPKGDKDSMKEPVIIHTDNDIYNCSSDNLQWVEKGSEEDVNYRKVVVERKRQRNEELNPRVDFPEFMQPKCD